MGFPTEALLEFIKEKKLAPDDAAPPFNLAEQRGEFDPGHQDRMAFG